jgi:hypothetical protein
MADPTSLHSVPDLDVLDAEFDLEQERRRTLSTSIRSRHALALYELMNEREDLHGVHALADQISESLRWSA